MPFYRQHFVSGQLACFACNRAESPIALMPSCPPGNLRHFRNRQPPCPVAVKFGKSCKGNMLDIKVQSHSNRIGGDKIVNLARLEHFDLRVAGAW